MTRWTSVLAGMRAGRGGRPHADQGELRRDRRHERRRASWSWAGWARDTGYEVRFIEYMPLDAQHAWEREKVVFAARILDAIDDAYPLVADGHENEPATTYRFADGAPGRIGVILPVSEPFCDTCNRLRLTAEGMFRNCLFAWTRRTPRRSARRVGRGARARDPHGPVVEVVRAPDQPSRLRAAGPLDVDDALTEPVPGSANPSSLRHPAFTRREA